ncbi:MAG: hypothetical protein ACRCYC_01985 [Paraclostridium sp.]|uniref:hypothetical protein n=1 Tax=Paraclostridium sp. TaxID=2023273 RepID=UPI003F3A8413
MKYKNNTEKVIISIACTMTVLAVLGFTLMQGTAKEKESDYVSKQINIKSQISENDYEILKKEDKDNKTIFIVLEKRNLNSEEISELTNQIVKDTSKKFEIYLFDNKEKANSFEYTKDQIQTLITPTEESDIQIQDYYIVNKEIENTPQYYTVESIKESKGKTTIELDLRETKKPEEALAQMKFLGQNIKDLNPNKDLENLEIKAYCKENTNPSWEYTSQDKQLIIHNEIVEL